MKKITYLAVCFTILSFLLLPRASLAKTEIKKAIVKIYTTQTNPMYNKPWHLGNPDQIYGSGCIIEGDRILTNGHVVSNETFIQVSKYGNSKKYKAKVLAVSHETDLALLTVEEKEFFKDVKPLLLGELPNVQDEVVVYGFPEGGETLCLTRGVISRIEHQEYVHSLKNFLAIQIDAAVNNGNSGGPAITDSRIIGIVMQGRDDAENIGYIVPTQIIKHFLKDLEDGHYDGCPEEGIIFQSMENENLKSIYGLQENESGVLVTSVIPGFPSEGIIHARDVILSIDGHDIADDGTVEFRTDERTSSKYFVQQHQIGEKISLEIIRKGEKQKLDVILSKPLGNLNLVAKPQYDTLPTYFIYGGLVFSPLTRDFLDLSLELDSFASIDLFGFFGEKSPTIQGEEVIAMINVLPHDVNNGYHNMRDSIITEVNGKRVNNLMELVHIVQNDTKTEFIEFKTKQNEYIVLNRGQAQEAQAEILAIYGVTADRSVDIQIFDTEEERPEIKYGKEILTDFSKEATLTRKK